jgi:hypothetical protein
MKPRWNASVSFLSPYRHGGETITYGLFEADTDWIAARQVTIWAAQHRYQEHGDTGFISMHGRNHFRASIGYRTRRKPEVLVGGTIEITLTPEDANGTR